MFAGCWQGRSQERAQGPGKVQVAGVVMWEAMHGGVDGGFEKERDPNAWVWVSLSASVFGRVPNC